jgi:hypothetical protein
MAESWEESAERAGFTPEVLRDLLVALRTQTLTLIKQGEEAGDRLDRLVIATEKTAARAFWIALPIYLGILLTLLSLVPALIGYLART